MRFHVLARCDLLNLVSKVIFIQSGSCHQLYLSSLYRQCDDDDNTPLVICDRERLDLARIMVMNGEPGGTRGIKGEGFC